MPHTFTLLDGGLGQELVKRSNLELTPLWSAITMSVEPALVEAVHLDYFDAGADVATTNSYILHRDRLAINGAEDKFKSWNIKACELANKARDQFGSGLIAGSMGPTGKSYRPDLAMEVEQGAEAYAEMAAIQAPFVDLFLLETLASIKQAVGAVQGALTQNKPIWVALTTDDEDGSLLRSKEPIADALQELSKYALDAILINCSVPEAVDSAVPVLACADKRFGVYANGFTKITEAFKEVDATVDSLRAREDLGPERYADFAQGWIDAGATIVGGCCEVGPAHIRELAKRFKR